MYKGFVLISPLMGIAVFLLVLSTVNLLSSEDARMNLMLQDTLKFREVVFHANRVTLDVFNASDWMFEEKLGNLMTLNHGYYDHGNEQNSYNNSGGIKELILSELKNYAVSEFSSTIADTQIEVYSDSRYNVFMNEWDNNLNSLYADVEVLDNFDKGENGSFIVKMFSTNVDSEPLVVLEDSSLSTSGFKSRVEAKALQKQSFHPRIRVFKYAYIVEKVLKGKFNLKISTLSSGGSNSELLVGIEARNDLISKIKEYFNSLIDSSSLNYFVDDNISIESISFSEPDLLVKDVYLSSEGVTRKKVLKLKIKGQLIDNNFDYSIVSNGERKKAKYSFIFELCVTKSNYVNRDLNGNCV